MRVCSSGIVATGLWYCVVCRETSVVTERVTICCVCGVGRVCWRKERAVRPSPSVPALRWNARFVKEVVSG